MPDSIDAIIQKAVQRDLCLPEFEAWAAHRGFSLAKAFDAISLTLATRFDNAEMSYEDADTAMNSLWHLMVTKASDRATEKLTWDWPKLSYEVYEAFDAGEFDHGDGRDPVETYTKPLVREILAGKYSPPS